MNFRSFEETLEARESARWDRPDAIELAGTLDTETLIKEIATRAMTLEQKARLCIAAVTAETLED